MWARDPWSAQDMSTYHNLCSPESNPIDFKPLQRQRRWERSSDSRQFLKSWLTEMIDSQRVKLDSICNSREFATPPITKMWQISSNYLQLKFCLLAIFRWVRYLFLWGVEDGGHIFFREDPLLKNFKNTSLPTSSVPDYHQLFGLQIVFGHNGQVWLQWWQQLRAGGSVPVLSTLNYWYLSIFTSS